MNNQEAQNEQLLLAEMQVLLSQLRTQLSILRAGMAIIAGSLTITFLLLTNHWILEGEWGWADLPVKIVLGLLAVLGLWRMANAERKIRLIQKLIHTSEHENKLVDKLIV
ncbi:MAG: hypothetical protein U1C66_01185 [Patescibacteria group bacterium]|nr:hypothetical protein [Patescibacteria group bacterium]